MDKCPHCGKPEFSFFRKLFMGSLLKCTCKQCGYKVSLSWKNIIFAIPFWINLYISISLSIEPVGLRLLSWLPGCLISIVLFGKYAKLVKR